MDLLKPIKVVAYLVYKNNVKTKTGIPYFNAILGVTLLFILNLIALLFFFGKFDLFLPSYDKNHQNKEFLIIALYLLPIIIFFRLLIKKSELENMNYSDASIKKGNRYLVLYFAFSIILIVFAIWYKKRIIV